MTTAAVCESRWVSTPMTKSTVSANMGFMVFSIPVGCIKVGTGLEEGHRDGKTVMRHDPEGVGQASDQASRVGQAGASGRRRHIHSKGTIPVMVIGQ